MDINMDNLSKLKMNDFYFSDIEFYQKKDGKSQLKISANHKIITEKNTDLENFIRVSIVTEIKEENEKIYLRIKSVGIFEVDRKIDHDIEKTIVKSIVAIMFPFIRSQVALITSQPGLNSIMLPIINVNDLVEKQN